MLTYLLIVRDVYSRSSFNQNKKNKMPVNLSDVIHFSDLTGIKIVLEAE